MRALFMDFPKDPNAANIPDEYMFGPAFLVAPVSEQGATHRSVYLPAGCDWYNYWTNERMKGGQTIDCECSNRHHPAVRSSGKHHSTWNSGFKCAAETGDRVGPRLSRSGCELHTFFRRREYVLV